MVQSIGTGVWGEELGDVTARRSIGMGAWRWEHGDESVEFFSGNLFSKIFFHPMIKMVYLFILELKHGRGE